MDQISKDISYSPIIILDNNRLRPVEAVDLLSKIDNYSKDRGIYDEAQEIPIDFGLLSDADIRSEIEKQGENNGTMYIDLKLNPSYSDNEKTNGMLVLVELEKITTNLQVTN